MAHPASSPTRPNDLSEAELGRQVIESAREGFVVLDRERRYCLWNRYLQRLTGLTQAEVLGRRVDEVFPELDPRTYDALDDVLAGCETQPFDLQVQTADGVRWFSAHHLPWRTDTGEVGGVIVSLRDITSRKRVEDELRESQLRSTLAMAAAGMAVWEVDVATRAVTWSENLPALFGRPSHEFPIDRHERLQLVHPEDQPRVSAAMEEALAHGTGFSIEFRVLLPDGSIRWLSSIGGSAVAAGRARVLGVMTDVTARHSLEAQLRQSQKLEAIGQLAGGVAHDFNNMLTAIQGYARFLLEDLEAPTQRRDVEQIMAAADRATALTRQLLTFTRRQVIETRLLDPNGVVRDLAHMLRRLIGEQITLATELGAEIHNIRADRGQIEQVLMNLVVNARDAMPDGGTVAITTANTVIATPSSIGPLSIPPGEYVSLRVSDTGHGMTDDVRHRLFEPFFTTKGPGRGTGLGLATVFGIVAQYGGAIDVETAPGKGTTFQILLPRAVGIAPEQPEAVRPAPSAGNEHVLLVEDDESVRFTTRITLERAGYQVQAAANAEEAEALFEAAPGTFAAVLTDIIMPGRTGVEMVATLKTRHRNLRVLYMSGYTDRTDLDLSRLDGAAFIQKPFKPEALLRRMRAVLDGRSAATA